MQDAGWYDDPTIPGQLRYWDGATWTDQVGPAPVVAPEPTGVPAFTAPPPVEHALPAFGAPPAFESPAPLAPHVTAPPPVPAPVPGSWGAPVPPAAAGAAGAMPGVVPSPVRPGMQVYDPDPPVRRSSIKARGAVAATILGMQATLPLLYGLSAVLLGGTIGSRFDEFDLEGGGSSGMSGVGSALTMVGVLVGAVGLLCLAASIGVGLRRRWGRLCAMIVETLGLLGVAWTFVQSGSLGTALAAIPPALVLGLVATDDSYG